MVTIIISATFIAEGRRLLEGVAYFNVDTQTWYLFEAWRLLEEIR